MTENCIFGWYGLPLNNFNAELFCNTNIEEIENLEFNVVSCDTNLFDNNMYHLTINCNKSENEIIRILGAFGFEVEDIRNNEKYWECDVLGVN